MYLGSWAASVDTELLSTHRVQAIVEVHDSPWGSSPLPTPNLAHSLTTRSAGAFGIQTVNGNPGIGKCDFGQIGRFKVAIADSTDGDVLRPHLEEAVHYIKERLARGENVLVHCQQVGSLGSVLYFRQSAMLYNIALLCFLLLRIKSSSLAFAFFYFPVDGCLLLAAFSDLEIWMIVRDGAHWHHPEKSSKQHDKFSSPLSYS